MSKLALNFAAPQRSLTAWHPASGLALLLAGLCALGFATWHYQQQLSTQSSLQAQRNHLRAQIPKPTSDVIPADLIPQIASANAAYALTQAPWEAIFDALEGAQNKASGDIALLSIKAASAKNELSLSGEAKDFGALHAYTAALSERTIFQSVTLSNDKLSTGAPPIVIGFELRLIWRAEAIPAH